MLAYLSRTLRNRQGFTLIELMVVIVILGILAGVAVQTMGSGSTDKAKEAKVRTDLRTIVSALEIYKMNEGNYPEEKEGGFNTSLKPLVDKGYLKSVPKNPDGWNYAYTHNDTDDTYTLIATLTGTGTTINANDLD